MGHFKRIKELNSLFQLPLAAFPPGVAMNEALLAVINLFTDGFIDAALE